MVQQVFGVTKYKSKTNNNWILYNKKYINILCKFINKNSKKKLKIKSKGYEFTLK